MDPPRSFSDRKNDISLTDPPGRDRDGKFDFSALLSPRVFVEDDPLWLAWALPRYVLIVVVALFFADGWFEIELGPFTPLVMFAVLGVTLAISGATELFARYISPDYERPRAKNTWPVILALVLIGLSIFTEIGFETVFWIVIISRFVRGLQRREDKGLKENETGISPFFPEAAKRQKMTR